MATTDGSPRCHADLPPNILLMMADDWGFGDLSSRGHPFLATPNLDQLRLEGTDFWQFQLPHAVCSPSRAGALTGRYPCQYCVHIHFGDVEHNNFYDMPHWLDTHAPTIPRILREQAGYSTAHFGKWHLSTENSRVPNSPSALEYGYDEAGGWTGNVPELDFTAVYDTTVDFVRRHHDRQWYVYLGLHQTHLAHLPSVQSMHLHAGLQDIRERVYAAVVTDADTGVGRVMAGLKQTNVADCTLVMFMSDNGPAKARDDNNLIYDSQIQASYTGGVECGNYCSVGRTHGLRGQKGSLFQGGVRSPFFVRWPGVTPVGAEDFQTVLSSTDLLPTLAAVAGVDAFNLPNVGPLLDGLNMIEALRGIQTPTRAKPLFWQNKIRGQSTNNADKWPLLGMRAGNYTLLMSAPAQHDQLGQRRELYDLTSDPAQQHDVSSDEPAVLEEMASQLWNWRDSLPSLAECQAAIATAEPPPPPRRPPSPPRGPCPPTTPPPPPSPLSPPFWSEVSRRHDLQGRIDSGPRDDRWCFAFSEPFDPRACEDSYTTWPDGGVTLCVARAGKCVADDAVRLSWPKPPPPPKPQTPPPLPFSPSPPSPPPTLPPPSPSRPSPSPPLPPPPAPPCVPPAPPPPLVPPAPPVTPPRVPPPLLPPPRQLPALPPPPSPPPSPAPLAPPPAPPPYSPPTIAAMLAAAVRGDSDEAVEAAMEAVGLVGLLVMGCCCCCVCSFCYLRMHLCRPGPSLEMGELDELDDDVRTPECETGTFAKKSGLRAGMGRVGGGRRQMGSRAFRQVPDEHAELDPWGDLKSTLRSDG